MMMKYILLLNSMVLGITGQFLLKKGVSLSSLAPNIRSIVTTVFSPYVFFGLALYGLSAIVWLFVLQRFPLSVAYPTLALTYVVIVAISVFVIHEPINSSKIFGIVLIVGGVFFLYR